MTSFKKYYIARIVITALFGIALGVLLLLAEPYANEIFDILLIAMGLLIVVMNLPAFLISLSHIKKKGEWISLLVSMIAIAFGTVIVLVKRDALLIALGAYSVVFPVLRICLVADRKKQLKRELPNVVFGLFLFFVSLLEVEELVFRVCGISILGITALYLLWSLLTMRPRFAAFDAYVQELALVEAQDPAAPDASEKE